MRSPARSRLVAIVLAGLVLGACVQFGLPEGATAEHRYFAAVADYTSVKVVAAKFAAQPTTPAGQAEAILVVAEDGDGYIAAIDAARRGDCDDPNLVERLPAIAAACEVTEADYATGSGALRMTSAILRKLALEEDE